MGADPRRSSAFGKANGGVKQDPRPIGDKNFFNSCMRTVIAYLSTHSYPYAVSPKLLASPTGKDFTQIVQFLFQRFDPALKAFGKVEDEVPLFFKRLNYPFQISKSALFAVGSPHSWPSVLAALTWLVELLEYEERAEAAAGGNTSSWNDRANGERDFFLYASNSYRHFLSGEDARCAAADEDMLGALRAREAALGAEVQSVRATGEELAAAVAALRAGPSPLAVGQARREECLADRSKFEAVIENHAATKASLQRKLAERAADLEARKRQLAEVDAANADLRARIAAQPLARADVNRLLATRSQAKQTLEAVVAQREEQERQLAAREAQVEGVLEGLEASLRAYHLVADRLALVPQSAKRAGGIGYEIQLERGAGPNGKLVSVDLKGVIKPGLARLRESYRARGRDLSEDCLALGEALDAQRERAGERAEEVTALEAQVRALEAQHRTAREAMEGEAAARSAAATKVQAEVAALRNSALAALADNEARLAQATAAHEAAVRAVGEEAEELAAAVQAALSAMLQHRLDIQQELAQVRASVAAAAAEVAACPAPMVGV